MASVVLAVPSLRQEVASLMPEVRRVVVGLPPGTDVPDGVGLPPTGYIGFATRCAVCDRDKLSRAVARLMKRGITVTIRRATRAVIPKTSAVEGIELTDHGFWLLGVDPNGPPVVARIEQGKFVGFCFASDGGRLDALGYSNGNHWSSQEEEGHHPY